MLQKARSARNAAKFERLWSGNWSEYPSQSEADLALCQMLAFWSRDPEQIDRLFRLSGFMRPKWDERHGEGTYGEMTISKALARTRETYQGPREPKERAGPASEEATQRRRAEGANLTVFNLSDAGNAERLVALHGPDIRFCNPLCKWFIWDGRRWAEDLKGDIYGRALDTIRRTHDQALWMKENPDLRKAILDKALGWEQRPKLEAMVALARYHPQVAVLPRDLDRDQWTLNVANGTLDLRTGELWPHRRQDLITKVAPVAYDPSAQAPLSGEFLRRIQDGDQENLWFLQKVVGYWLTGTVREQVLAFLHGRGANGKTTFVIIILRMLGDYGRQAAPGLLIEKRGDSHPTEVADLMGCRLAVCTEVGRGARLAEVLVKQITGGDRMKARFMRQDFFEFEPTHKVVLAANHRPDIRGTDHAIWRRIRLVPFEVIIPPEEQDPELVNKLEAELPGILAWAVRGCLAWQREGLMPPPKVQEATDAYRQDVDLLADFLAEKCILSDMCSEPARALYESYVKWCESAGETPIKQRTFGEALTERGLRKDRSGPRGNVVYFGIGLTTGGGN